MVAVGAAFGGAVRHAVMTAVARWCGERFPWGTLAVNLAGSVLLGAIFGAHGGGSAMAGWQVLGTVGFCGGLTTFSTFAWQSLTLVSQRRWGALAGNVAGSVGLCIGGVAAGYLIGGGGAL